MTPKTQASIRTTFLGPTNHLGQRIAVTNGPVLSESHRLIVNWASNLHVSDNHLKAAEEWLAKHNPQATVSIPGYAFGDCYYWTWHFEEVNQ